MKGTAVARGPCCVTGKVLAISSAGLNFVLLSRIVFHSDDELQRLSARVVVHERDHWGEAEQASRGSFLT
jgi:hypothetical protein